MKLRISFRLLIYIALVFSNVLLLYHQVGTGNMLDLYYGIPFDSDALMPYFVQLFMFSIYLFFGFMSYRTFISNEGIYLLVRYQKRHVLVIQIFQFVVKSMILIEVIKICSYCIITMAYGKSLFVSDIKTYLTLQLFDVMVMLIFMTLQACIEVLISAKIGLIFCIICYQGLITLGDWIYYYDRTLGNKFYLISNLPMRCRQNAMVSGTGMELLFLITVLVIVEVSFIKLLKMKDII